MINDESLFAMYLSRCSNATIDWPGFYRDGTCTSAQFVVVGGGPAGIELSLAIRARFNDMLDSKLSIILIDSSDGLVTSETPACQRAMKSILSKYKIDIRLGLLVDEVTSSHVHVYSKSDECKREEIPYSHIIWATGAEAHELSWSLNKQCGLEFQKHGVG